MLPNLEKLIIGLHYTYVVVNSEQTPFSVVYSLSVLKYASQQAAQPWWDMEQSVYSKYHKQWSSRGLTLTTLHPWGSVPSRNTLLLTSDFWSYIRFTLMQIQLSSLRAFLQLQTQLKGLGCWKPGVLSVLTKVTTSAPSFPFWDLHGSVSEEISGRCGFIDSKLLGKGEVKGQFMNWVLFS